MSTFTLTNPAVKARVSTDRGSLVEFKPPSDNADGIARPGTTTHGGALNSRWLSHIDTPLSHKDLYAFFLFLASRSWVIQCLEVQGNIIQDDP